jgi:hypothetical protein
MYDATYYEQLRARTRDVLTSVDHWFPPAQASLLDELIDVNECGVAVEMISAMLQEFHADVRPDEATEIDGLVRDMGLAPEIPAGAAVGIRALNRFIP